jgi:hypothetical protein
VGAVGPYVAGALAAHDLGDTGPDHDRRFDFVMTRNRDLVIEAARTLTTRIAPTA